MYFSLPGHAQCRGRVDSGVGQHHLRHSWGFGFVGWIHQPVEPLLMVVPCC